MQVVSLWRYPVKSMMGEELNACDVTKQGVRGDRAYGVVDQETGKLANAKNPKKWPEMFYYRAAYTEPIHSKGTIPPVRISMPNGRSVLSSEANISEQLSQSFARQVKLTVPSQKNVQFEGYVPEEIEELSDRGTIFSKSAPAGTFFDIAMLHIVTTATIDRLRELAPNSRIEPRRFRPNLIIDVPEGNGFVEEEWVGKTLYIGEKVKLKIIQPTKRCVMTTLAQGDLPKDANVLRTLVQKNKGNFGVYAHVIQTGRVKIGDPITVR